MAITSATAGTLASSGAGSGLDINGLVSKLMAVEALPLQRLAVTEASYQAKITAYGSLQGALGSLQTSLASMLDVKNMRGVTTSLADTSIASVATGSSAVPGTYSLQVDQLAQAQKIASAGFAATTDAVGTGTLSFDFGTFAAGSFTPSGSGAKTVTIGAGQNTLTGIRDAVNAAAIGVTATVINDGSAAGNRLVFTSNTSGAAGSLKVSVADADGNNGDALGLSQLAYNPAGTAGNGRNMSEKVAAQDAQFVIDGIAIAKPSNVVNDAIQGITLTLSKKSAGVPTTLTVTADSSSVRNSVQGFVKAYNDLHATIAGLTKYNATTKQSSTLTGDSTPRLIESQLRAAIGGSLGSGAYTTLSQIGVSFQADGSLKLDSAKLTSAAGSDSMAVARLFAAATTATDARLTPSVVGRATQPGSYAINITRIATQGDAVGSGLAGLTVTAGVNDTLTATVNGSATTVKLEAKTYADASALAAEVQSKVNGALSAGGGGLAIAATQSAGILRLASAAYGSGSSVKVSGNAVTGLFGGAATQTTGVDVAGTIDGVNATGTGQTLTAGSGGATEGLSVNVDGGSMGARGNVVHSQGYASRLNVLVTSLLGSDGVVAASREGVNKRIADVGDRREAIQQRLVKLEATYRAQFNALDTMLGTMTTTSNYLTQQLANLPKLTLNN